MLAENIAEWTRELERKGIEKTVLVLRGVLLSKLEERFGALPDAARQRVEALASVEELAELISRQATAPSLTSLGLI